MRDRKRTENQIIKALDKIILKKGFKGLGVNAVAKEAGVSKILIYRYFDDFNGLLSAWALKNSYWVGRMKAPDLSNGILHAGTAVLWEQADALISNPVLREVERWLLAEETEAGDTVMKKLEENGCAISGVLLKKAEVRENIDGHALIALLTAGIAYLSLKSDRCNVYNGVPLDTEEGWMRIKRTIADILKLSISGT